MQARSLARARAARPRRRRCGRPGARPAGRRPGGGWRPWWSRRARATPPCRGSTSNRPVPSGVRAATSSTSARGAVEHVVRLAVQPQSPRRPGGRRTRRSAGSQWPAGPVQARAAIAEPSAMRGQQPLAGRLVAGGEQRPGRRGRPSRARRRGEVAPEFLHHDVGLDRPGAGAAVALRDREPGDADLPAQPPPERLVVRPACPARACRASSPRTASRRSRCSAVSSMSGSPSAVSRAP